MPKFGDRIQAKDKKGSKWFDVHFISEAKDYGVLCVDSLVDINNIAQGDVTCCSPYQEWREIPKPKRVHWEREDYPKVPRYYKHKICGNNSLVCTFTEDKIYINHMDICSYKQFAKEFDLLNEDGSLTELYKEVSE